MIRYALTCGEGHPFEAWFPGSDAYDAQAAGGLIECPVCGSTEVKKQIMAPAVSKSGSGEEAGRRLMRFAGAVREHIAKTHEYVGDRFAAEARAMHAGEKDAKPVWGETTPGEAKALAEEGVPAEPLPAIFTPTPKKKLN